jgi:hypothetical protein
MNPAEILSHSKALWNMSRFDLGSDEALSQILDRGSLEDWSALYALMRSDGDEALRLRERVHGILYRVPEPYPWFWLAALSALGHPVDWSLPPKRSVGEARI